MIREQSGGRQGKRVGTNWETVGKKGREGKTQKQEEE